MYLAYSYDQNSPALLILFIVVVYCAARDAMRGQVRCELVAFAGAGGAMLLTRGKTKGFIKTKPLKGVWGGWSGSRVEGMGG